MNKNFCFTIAVRDIREALPELRKLVRGKVITLPVLGCILVERDKGATRLTATDLDARLTYEIPSDIAPPASELGKKLQQNRSDREDGAICVPVEHLSTALKNADKASDITITQNALTYRFAGNKASLGGDFLSAEEFPPGRSDFKDEHPLSEPAKHAIVTALPCASTDETRYILQGVYYESEKNAIVATDGNQGVYFEIPIPQLGNFIMPSNAVKLLTGKISKLPWAVSVAEAGFQIHAGYSVKGDWIQQWTLQSKTIEGNYPNFRKVFPPRNDKAAAIYHLNTFNRLTITDGLKRLPKNTASEHDPVLVGVGAGDQMKFSAGKDNSFAVTLTKGVGNKPRCVQCNRAFWQRLIDLGSTEIRIQDEKSPVVGYKNGASNMAYVFMPVRLG